MSVLVNEAINAFMAPEATAAFIPLAADVGAITKQSVTRRFKARLHWSWSSVEPAWRSMQAEGHCTAYQSDTWVVAIQDHLLAPVRAKAFFVEVIDADLGMTVMLLPFALTRRFGFSVVTWLSLGVCDYAAPLLARDVSFSPDQAQNAWTAIRSVFPRTDVIDISQISADVLGTTNPLAQLPQCRLMDLQAFGIAIKGDPKTFMSRLLGAKAFKELNKQRRRLQAQGDVRFVEAKTEPELSHMFEIMLEHRIKRFRKLGRADILSRPQIAAFYRSAALQSIRDDGPARVFGISVDGEWVATAYVLEHAQVMHGIILAIGDDAWMKYSPGLLMVCALLEWSVGQGHIYHDLTIGNLPYKADMGAQPRPLYRILQAETLLGLIAVHTSAARANAKAWLRGHPRLFKPLRVVRQRMRRMASFKF